MKDPFLKTVSDACQILAGWHNMYGHNPKYTVANDGVTFATTVNNEDTETKNKKDKKKTYHFLNARKTVSIRTNVLMMRRKARTDQFF